MSANVPARFLACAVSLLCACAAADRRPSAAENVSPSCLIDLTYPYDDATIYWPTAPSRFRKETLSYGMTKGGYFYSAYEIATPEHGGTHLDAPIHFAEGQATTDQIPLRRLIAHGAVIDISSAAAEDRDALVTVGQIEAFEHEHGAITPGTIVLIRTGWGRYWPNVEQYLGDDTPGDTSNLHFPGISEEAARALVSRQVGAVGIDTASLDYGPSRDFVAHRVLLKAGIPGFENVANLDQVPPRGAEIIALPMKIAGGSGGPLRIVAVVPASRCRAR
jgi:kynurenine formamidase